MDAKIDEKRNEESNRLQMEHSLSALVYKGSIPKAILESKKQKKLFVVYISGSDEKSVELEKSTWTDSKVAESLSNYCIFLHIPESSTDAANFRAIYPQKSVPSIAAIGYNGVQLWQNEGIVSAEVLASSLEKAWLGLHIQGGPWTFSQHLLIMKELKKGEKATNVQLNTVDMWVRVYDVPNGFMMRDWEKVSLDVRKPIKKSMKLAHGSVEIGELNFKYERLPTFCFFCGIIVIGEKWLRYEPPEPEEDGSSGVGEEMQAEQFSGDNQVQSKGRDKECNLSNVKSEICFSNLGTQYGDFNDILALHEKQGNIAHPNWLIVGFRSAIHDCSLCDLGMVGYAFTWERSRGQPNWVQEPLDRVLGSHDWCNLFLSTTVYNLEGSTFDHSPIYLHLNAVAQVYRAKRFKFENKWLEEPECKDMVASSWAKGVGLDIFSKIRVCTEELSNWGIQMS
ncbi:hypothetical protein GH714_008689 [Hevea brasiliensis]|uniref:Zinc knuckle CX2CX4HX4C domain-containing protein n=1 Tax=Hevea brasiliensis TaxID=3981 RepID=A0A6A6NA78_HEVBR|nr:hypothetical protein GH714_008689 [Hevea brasiliensis]